MRWLDDLMRPETATRNRRGARPVIDLDENDTPNRRDPFGRVLPDPRFEALRDTWAASPEPAALFGDDVFRLDDSVGANGRNGRADIAKLETLLGSSGHLDLAKTDGPTGYYGSRIDRAVRSFQTDHGLKVDGRVDPQGQTIRTLAAVTIPRATQRIPPTVAARHGAGGLLGMDPSAKSPPERMAQPREPDPLLQANYLRLLERLARGAGSLLRNRGGPTVPPPPMIGPEAAPKIDHAVPQRIERPQQPAATPSPSQREALADDVVQEVMRPLESHRGDETTKRGNDIVAQECRKVLEEDYPDLADRIDHVGGATRDGESKDRLDEKYVPRVGRQRPGDHRGSSHPDLSWYDRRRDPQDSEAHAHANTATQRKRGGPTARERRSFENLKRNVGERLATEIPKLRPGSDEDEYRKVARETCREVFRAWLGEPRSKTESKKRR